MTIDSSDTSSERGPGAGASICSWLQGGGEMGGLIRSKDWSATPLGSIDTWSPTLRMMVRFLLANRFPLLLWWGPRYVCIYNDAYRPILGGKHPAALGSPVDEVWSEIWHILKPLIDRPFHGGPPTWNEDILLELNRHGFTEETHFTIAYSPVPDDTAASGIGGVLATVHEITEKVIGERRVVALRDLGAHVGDAKTVEQACEIAARTLAAHDKDVPFVLLYLVDSDGEYAQLAGSTGIAPGDVLSPVTVNLRHGADSVWPFQEGIRQDRMQVVPLTHAFGSVPAGPWADPPSSAVVVPIPSNRPHEAAGIMVAGVSARIGFDQYYQDFIELVRTQVAAAISHARAYEEERKRAEALAEIDRAKTAFFSNISHEFRTPLTLLVGPLEDSLSETAAPLPPVQRERNEVAHRNALRLLRLVNTLLDFSRIEAGRIDASYEPTDLSASTAELASVFRSAIEKAGLSLVVECDPLPEPVYVDRDMWEKIVLNLVSNAFKFTFEGRITVGLGWAGEFAELRVSDTGVGISDSELPRMFERFHRVKHVRARTHEGSGIGLALVQELARLHGGNVSVASQEGLGTTFTVRIRTGTKHLPADRIGAGRPRESAGAMPFVEEALRWLPSDFTPPPSTAARVLIADDNADMRDYLARILGQHYRVETVGDGAEALARVQANPPELVLTDVMMPNLDGFGLLSAIRADDRTRAIPVVMLSARAGEEARIEGLEAGADEYLAKPFSARELLATVGSQLRLSQVRRESERALRHRGDQHQTLLNQVPIGVYLVDADFRICEVNPIALPVFGDIPGGVIGRDFGEIAHILWPEQYANELIARFRYTLETGEPCITPEQSEVRKDRGVIEYYEWRIDRITLPDGRYGVVCYFRDISERKHAELERIRLLQETAMLTETLNNVGAIVASDLDQANVVQAVTDAATELTTAAFGAFFYNVTDHAGESYTLYTISGASREAFSKFPMPRNTEVFGPTFTGAGVVRSADITKDPRYGRNPPFYGMPCGHLPVKSYLAVPVKGRKGEVIGGLFFGHPNAGRFTEQHERLALGVASWASVALENARLYASVQEASRIKDEFLASLSHELRTPLNAILGYARMLRSGIVAPQRRQKALQTIERNATSLTQIVEDVLDISRIVSGKIRLNVQPVELPDVIRRAIDAVALAAEAKGVHIETMLDPQATPISGDPERLQQVLWNLLSNAVKFTNSGGKVEVRLERMNSHAEVTVTDTGVGISPDFLPHMFERFRQADGGIARRWGGLGLGLSIARQLTEMHGGTIEAESGGLNQGATFRVKIPLMIVHPMNEAVPRSHPQAGPVLRTISPDDLRGLHVLAVDDEPDALQLVSEVLETAGARVSTATSAVDALTRLEAELPDVIVADLGMPQVDGLQFIDRVRRHSNPQIRSLPAAALTAYARSDDRLEALKAGFHLHLAKPIDPAELVATLAGLAGRGSTPS